LSILSAADPERRLSKEVSPYNVSETPTNEYIVSNSGREGMQGIGKTQLMAPITGTPRPMTKLIVAAPATATNDAGTLGKYFGRIKVVAKVPRARTTDAG
jgi:hypothetical protein